MEYPKHSILNANITQVPIFNSIDKNQDMSDITTEPYIEVKEIITHKKWNKYYDQNALCKCGQKYNEHFDFEQGGISAPCSFGFCKEFKLAPVRSVKELKTLIYESNNLIREEAANLNKLKKELDNKYHKISIPLQAYVSANYLQFKKWYIEVIMAKTQVHFKILKDKFTFEEFKNHVKKYTL